MLLQDNTGLDTPGVTQNVIQQFIWEQFDHPPTPLITHFLTTTLTRVIMQKHCVWHWLSSLAASVFAEDIEAPHQCLDNGGSYVENSLRNVVSYKNGIYVGKNIATTFSQNGTYFPDMSSYDKKNV